MKLKKAALTVVCAGALVVGSVAATMAYLTDDDSVVNTFTVGKVQINLDETDYDKDSNEADNVTVDDVVRDKANKYHLLPGQSYVKDPTVTVLKGSDSSYVRVFVTVENASAVQAIIDADNASDNAVRDYADLFAGWNSKWLYEGFKADEDANMITFEFRYEETVAATEADVVLPAVFEQIVVPGYVTNAQLEALYGNAGAFQMNVIAQAIQAAGFDTADAAWAAWK